MKRVLIIVIIVASIACSDQGYLQSKMSKAIWSELEANDFNSIDFSKLGGGAWTRVCFLGPYNQDSEQALGFDWQVAEHTDVLKSDGHNVIVFATDTEVIEYVVHSRKYGDFSKLSGECLAKNASQLTIDQESGNRRNYVLPSS